jgi:hypothetical protein
MKYYNLIQLSKAYNDNKHIINAHINKHSIEGYTRDTDINVNNTAILGMTIEIFLLFFIITLVLWICGLVLLINNWNIIPDWAKVVGVFGLLPIIPGGPIVTIVLVLIITKQQSR